METLNVPAPRTPLQLEVDFRKSYARESHKATLKNISITGAFLESKHSSFKANEKIQLTFEVSDRQRKISAVVVWSNAAGCGVKFLPMNNRDVQIVDDLIYYVESNRHNRRDVLENILKRVS